MTRQEMKKHRGQTACQSLHEIKIDYTLELKGKDCQMNTAARSIHIYFYKIIQNN